MEENIIMQEQNIIIPKSYKPLSTWAYFGYNLLFNIPIIGFILLIIFSFNNNNINRRNFARSYFCLYLLMIILMIIVVISIASVWDSVIAEIEPI